MAEKVVTYKVKIVNENGEIVETLASDFNTLKKSVGDLEKELQNTDFGSEQFRDLEKELKKSKGALKEAEQSTMSLGQKFAAIPGPIGAVSQSVMGLGTAFKALIANPIGAVIAALGIIFMGLYKALTSTEKGMFALNKVMGALSGLLTPIITLLQEVSMVLIDGVLKGVELLQAGLEALGFDAFAEASRDATALAQSINEVEDAEGQLAVERAKQNKQLAEAREILADTNVSLADRKKALKEVQKSEEDLAAKEVQLSQKRLANIREEIRLKGASKDLNDAEEQALIQLFNTQQSQAAVRRKNIKAEAALERENEAKLKEAENARKEREKARVAAAEQKKKDLADAAKFETDLNLRLITDAEQKARKTLEIEKQTQLDAVNNLKVTEEKKAQLRLGVEQDYLNKLGLLDADAKKKQDEADAAQLAKEEAARQTALMKEQSSIDAALELERMRLEKTTEFGEDDLNKTIELLTRKTQLLLQNEELTAEQRLLIEAQLQDQITAVQQAGKEQQDILVQQQLGGIAQGFGNIAAIAGETTAIGKLAGVAQATINTYLSATEAFKSTAGIPVVGPVLAPIAAAAAIAAGLKSVQQIMSVNDNVPKPQTKFSLGGVVSGQGGMYSDNVQAYLSPGETIINSRSSSMFQPLLSSINQAGGGVPLGGGIVQNGVDMGQVEMLSAMRSKNKQPVKAYVVSSEMTNQIMLERQTRSRSLI